MKYLRHPRTTQEKRNYDDEYSDYVRPKRKPKNLPDVYDDFWIHYQKSWKSKKVKKQYLAGKRKRYTIKISRETDYSIMRNLLQKLYNHTHDVTVKYEHDNVVITYLHTREIL